MKPDGEGRLQRVFVLSAGVMANLAATGLLLAAGDAVGRLGEGWLIDVAQPIVGGLALSQFAAVINLASLNSPLDGLPSDGRQILRTLFGPHARPDAFTVQVSWALIHLTEQRTAKALEAIRAATSIRPEAAWTYGAALHCLIEIEGGASGLAYYRDRRHEIEAALKASAGDEAAYVHANIAWAALKADPIRHLTLLDRHSAQALALAPELAVALGARGGYLLASGDTAASRPLLIQALRSATSDVDRAEFAGELAEVARRNGDATVAGAFEALRRRALSTGSGPA
jgi:hypothetical protein